VNRHRHKPSWEGDEHIGDLLCLIPETPSSDLWAWRIPLLWAIVAPLGRLAGDEGAAARSASLMDDWMLGHAVTRTFVELGADESRARYEVTLIGILARHQGVSTRHRMRPPSSDMWSMHRGTRSGCSQRCWVNGPRASARGVSAVARPVPAVGAQALLRESDGLHQIVDGLVLQRGHAQGFADLFHHGPVLL